MCLNPVKLPNGIEVACRECRLCRDNRVNDWVGRCIAESKTCDRAYAVTLTYGGDDRYGNVNPEATVLSYTDIRRYLALVRKWSKPAVVRFFVTGEFGSAKGRAHWHMLLFLTGGEVPNVRWQERYRHDDGNGHMLWPHGFSYWEEAAPHNIRYTAKYILKQKESAALKGMGLSSKPPLGDAYFKLEAARYVDQGLAPQDLFYRFPMDRLRNGQTRTYKLAGAPAFNYLHAFAHEWERRFGNQSWPQSELMDAFIEERARRARVASAIPDFPEDVFLERMEMERLEKRGKWWHHVDVKESGGTLIAQSQTSFAKARASG